MRILSKVLWLLTLATAAGCVNYQEIVSFDEAALAQAETIEHDDPIEIQADDLLRITVHSFDPLAAAPFNLEPVGMGQAAAQGPVQLQTLELFSGYFVDRDGYVDFPVLGRIGAAGLTLEALKAKLRERLTTYLKDPVVNVRFLNLRVTVLGEVNTPGQLRLTNPRLTLLEALGLAGDLTAYADRSDVLVIREDEGQRRYAHLNLHTGEIFDSEFYYLEQNDLIYVRPIQARVATVADPGQRFLQYLTATLSAAALAIALIVRN